VNNFNNYWFIVPSSIFILMFMIFPIFYNMFISFQDITLMNLNGVHAFVGLSNYITTLKDTAFHVAFKNSIIFTIVCIAFQFSIGFIFALYFNRKFPGRDVMRSFLLLAWMMPIVITASLFKWMLSGDGGVFNYLLQLLGIIKSPIFWLSESNTSLLGTILANVWIGIPFNMILLLSGLQSLPESLYEAAKIDGAGKIRQFFNITLPLMKPTLLILLMLGIIYTFKVFDLIFIMTGGGPVNSSTVLPLYAFQLSFSTYEISQGAAVSTVMIVFLSVIALCYLWLVRKEEKQ